jgi:hypothetical protein
MLFFPVSGLAATATATAQWASTRCEEMPRRCSANSRQLFTPEPYSYSARRSCTVPHGPSSSARWAQEGETHVTYSRTGGLCCPRLGVRALQWAQVSVSAVTARIETNHQRSWENHGRTWSPFVPHHLTAVAVRKPRIIPGTIRLR